MCRGITGGVMLRLHLTVEDLARVVLFNHLLPQMNEAVLSLQILRRTDQGARYGRWRGALRGQVPALVRPLAELVPVRGWIPDFLTPAIVDTHDGADVLEGIRSTSRHQIADELRTLAGHHAVPSWVGSLAHGDADTMTALTRGLAAYHQVAIAPHAQQMQAALDSDLAIRTTILARRGVGALLNSLHPALLWEPPVLTIPAPYDADVHLAGRGLVLVPMVFCGPTPRFLPNQSPDEIPVLAYQLPVDPSTGPFTGPPSSHHRKALDKILGTSRSLILHLIHTTPGLTTGQLAQRADLSLASASEHATTLRNAGLVTSHRDHGSIRHYSTPTTTSLLTTHPT
jgi:DNA-binding transcriptional ArsR family regulator